MAENEGGCTPQTDVLGHYARQLTEEERVKFEADIAVVSEYKRDKFEREAKKNWDLFYKRNSTHFFKDRHWITREFPELLLAPSDSDQGDGSPRKVVLLEAGCGVGNTVFPLLAENNHLFVYACDFSSKAIDLLKVCAIVRFIFILCMLCFYMGLEKVCSVCCTSSNFSF